MVDDKNNIVIDELLKPILKSPKLPQLLEQLASVYDSEKERRLAFLDWVTPDIKAEFIDGEIIIHSPVRSKHTLIVKRLLMLLDVYVKKNDLGYVGMEKVMVNFPRNNYEPDLCFFNKQKSAQITGETVLFPIPNFVIEVLSPSTEDRDRGVKFEDYAANGVEEYWIIDPDTQMVEQYLLKGSSYNLNYNFFDGTISCQAILGLQINHTAIFNDKANLEALMKL